MKKSTIKTQFLTGLLIILPVGVTIWVLWLMFISVGKAFLPILRVMPILVSMPALILEFISFISTLVLIWMVGIVSTNFLGKKLLYFIEQRILLRVPLAKYIYPSLRHLTNAVVGKQKFAFKRVILLEYPRKRIYTVAFVTNEVENEEGGMPKGPMLHVFIPTTPNPTSGWFALVPKEEAIPLELSVEEGIKLVISGGIVTPPLRGLKDSF
ncbi:MAG: DUF502 domain-containing protein [bacterium]